MLGGKLFSPYFYSHKLRQIFPRVPSTWQPRPLTPISWMLDDEWSGEGSTRIEDDPTPSVLSRFLALYWTAEYKERVTIKHVHSNTQFVTVSNTNKPFAIEAPVAETTGGTAYSPILKFIEYQKEYDI